MGAPLVVTDDDVAGTFTFLRAMPDHGNNANITPEQIGSQIFIDGWGMIAPGDPERAADFARRAASVSHDGEAIYGAQAIAAMEALAFVEPDLDRLLDVGVSLIPADSTIARVIGDVRDWHAAEPDWRRTRESIDATYGADIYKGNCHIVPNHALIILALLYGNDDFRGSLTIVSTAGLDTDCNSGNVGALLGIKNGLAGIDSSPYDWCGPVADRLYLPTADGGRAITDAVRETYEIVNIGRALAGEPRLAPKDGAKFHFELPGSVQGFIARGSGISIANSAGQSTHGTRTLAIRWGGERGDGPLMATTATFTPPEAIDMPFYTLLASPTLYPGQEVRARVVADSAHAAPVSASIAIRFYGERDAAQTLTGPPALLAPGSSVELAWRMPDLGGAPIFEVGIAVQPAAATSGSISLDWLTWEGAPDVTLGRPEGSGAMWRRTWVDGVDRFESRPSAPYRISQDTGAGLLSQGTVDWKDYRVSADLAIVLAQNGGIAARVGGMRRWYGLVVCDDGVARLVKHRDALTVLAEQPFSVELDRTYHLELSLRGNRIEGEIDGTLLLAAVDEHAPLLAGGVAIVVTRGTVTSGPVRVQPVRLH